MNYTSTRSNQEPVASSRAILDGIAADGGLYVPQELPQISIIDSKLLTMSYQELAYYIMNPFFSDFEQKDLMDCISTAYQNKFEYEDIATVSDILGMSFLELQHGPTQAFKDMALSILPHLMKKSMKIQNDPHRIAILAATSGDTGKAALQGFANVEDTIVIVFYPKDGVSEIQKKQMITQQGANTHVIGLNGNFDDAQMGVKNIFADKEFNDFLNTNGYKISSANSINIGRLIPQIVYYFHGYLHMCRMGNIAPGESINVVVPTGNFGNILAAFYAKQMGLPIHKLICASNENNVLYDFFHTGIYDRNRDLKVTISPSMDILVSSNLERLLYELSDHDAGVVSCLMNHLKCVGKYEIPEYMKDKLKVFYSNYAVESEIRSSINNIFQITGQLIDTHTAVAHSVYEKYLLETGDTTKTMIVATASPFKFGKSVLQALGQAASNDEFETNRILASYTKTKIPQALKDLEEQPAIHNRICSSKQMKDIIKEILLDNKGD